MTEMPSAIAVVKLTRPCMARSLLLADGPTLGLDDPGGALLDDRLHAAVPRHRVAECDLQLRALVAGAVDGGKHGQPWRGSLHPIALHRLAGIGWQRRT